MNAITDFKSIRQKLDRMEQKAEYAAKNPKADQAIYGWPYMTPLMKAILANRSKASG